MGISLVKALLQHGERFYNEVYHYLIIYNENFNVLKLLSFNLIIKNLLFCNHRVNMKKLCIFLIIMVNF